MTSVERKQRIARLLDRLNHAALGEGFSLKISRTSFERKIASGHQAFCLLTRMGWNTHGQRVIIVEPGVGIEFSAIRRLIQYVRDPETVCASPKPHYLIDANVGLITPGRKGMKVFGLSEDNEESVAAEINIAIKEIARPIMDQFQRLEDFADPSRGTKEVRELLRRALLSRLGWTYFTSGPEAAVSVVNEQVSYFYGFGDRAGRAGTELLIERIRSYDPAPSHRLRS